MKKVLLVATVQSHICQFHRLLADLLHEHGCEVHVAARDNLAEKNGLKLDFAEKIFNVPFARSPKDPVNIKAYRMLKQIIMAEGYDIIHCNTPMGGILTRLAAKKARKQGTKVLYTAHGFHFYQGAPKKNWMVYYPIEKWFARKTDKLITIVSEDFETATKRFRCPVFRIHGVGVDEKRYFPVDSQEKLALRAQMNFEDNQKIILCIGELLLNKNHRMAIRAMAEIVKQYPDAKLLIAGNGPEKEHLEDQIAALGLQENVILLGYVTNLQDYQHIADLLIACSIREGLGLNVIEAMMSGNPVVLSDNRGHRELVDSGNNGYLVAPHDDQAMAECVLRIFKDSEARQRFSDNAIAFAQKYNYTAVKMELERIYEF